MSDLPRRKAACFWQGNPASAADRVSPLRPLLPCQTSAAASSRHWPPQRGPSLQAPGFQYILRYSTHSCDITSVALATKLKLAAVADESGTLSLLDLLQPAQLFSTRVMQQAVAHAVFGSHVVPGVKDEPGVER